MRLPEAKYLMSTRGQKTAWTYATFPLTAQDTAYSEAFHRCSFIIKFYVLFYL